MIFSLPIVYGIFYWLDLPNPVLGSVLVSLVLAVSWLGHRHAYEWIVRRRQALKKAKRFMWVPVLTTLSVVAYVLFARPK